MKQMMKDADYVCSLITDIFTSEGYLGRDARDQRTGYNLFMFGLVMAAFSFGREDVTGGLNPPIGRGSSER